MALTVQELEAQRDEILRSLSAPQETQVGGRKEVDRSIEEKERALALIERQIANLSPAVTGSRTIVSYMRD